MRRPYVKKENPFYRYTINDRIQGTELRVLDEAGEQIGLLSRSDALALAEKEGVDLVLIAAQAVPPVAKVIDFRKFLYQEEKKGKESKKATKKGGTKDIQISLFIGEADLERQRKRANEFIEEGHQLRIRLRLKSKREFGKLDMVREKINEFIVSLGDEVKVVREPIQQGKAFMAIVVRNKK